MKALVVDGNNLAFRSSVVQSLYADGKPTGLAFSFLKVLRACLERYRPKIVVVCWDGGRSVWRKSLYPGYKDKGKRSGPLADDKFRASIYQQIRSLRHDLLPLLPLYQWGEVGVEADDLIRAAVVKLEKFEVFLSSTDKDFYQLLPYCSLIRSKGLYSVDDFRREYGFDPRVWPYYRALTGDSSDNIPGLPGVGPVAARNIVLDQTSELSKKQLKVLEESRHSFALYLKLIDLDQYPHRDSLEGGFQRLLRGGKPKVDVAAFQRYLVKHQMSSIVRDIEIWRVQFEELI